MNRPAKIIVALGTYALASALAYSLYPILAGAAQGAAGIAALSILGASLAWFTHLSILGYGLATITILPFVLAYVTTGKAWGLAVAFMLWLVWGAGIAYTLIPLNG